MNEKKKKTLLILGVIAGLILQFAGITAGPDNQRIISGSCIGAGALLFPLCLGKLQRLSREKEFPWAVRQEEIEFHDERNTQIRSRAKARTSDISRWVVASLAWINFLVQGYLWMTLALMGVFVLAYILDFCYIEKYQNEM